MKQYIYHESGGQSFTMGNKCCHNYYTNPINKLNGSKPQPHFNIPTTPENGSELRFKQRTWNNILIMSGGQSFTIEKRCCHHYFTTPINKLNASKPQPFFIISNTRKSQTSWLAPLLQCTIMLPATPSPLLPHCIWLPSPYLTLNDHNSISITVKPSLTCHPTTILANTSSSNYIEFIVHNNIPTSTAKSFVEFSSTYWKFSNTGSVPSQLRIKHCIIK